MVTILFSIQNPARSDLKNMLPSSQRYLHNEELCGHSNLNADFGEIPLYFIPNEGQLDETALFYAKTSRYTLWLTKEGLVFDSTRNIGEERAGPTRRNLFEIYNPGDVQHEREISKLVFLRAKRSLEVVPADIAEHTVNFFIGNDPSSWRSDIQTSKAVLYREIYPNIDLKVYGLEKQIEYDFVVKPGGDVSDITFEYRGVEKTGIDEDGNLVVNTRFGEMEHARPVGYQVIGGERVEVEAAFERIEEYAYGFQVEEYDKDYELIIDPLVLVYSTFLGGSGTDAGRSIAFDSSGSMYVAGYTDSVNFPTNNPFQGTKAGDTDIFIAKINASGTGLVFSTYLGGSREDSRCETPIAVDSVGSIYIAGYTDSVDFPIMNPIQGIKAGGWDTFIAKINSAGNQLIYSTYLGGSGTEQILGMALDSKGAAYVTGYTDSANFPTKNPMQGSTAGGIDVFIAKINASGTSLVFSTYLGGHDAEGSYGIAVNSEGAAYVTGSTNSFDFPTKNPFQGSKAGGDDVYIAKINPSGTALIYSTYLGGSGEDYCFDIAADPGGAAYVTGSTNSVDFPTQNPIQGNKAGDRDVFDAFITKINSAGNELIYSTYLGGSDEESGGKIAVDPKDAAYVGGCTSSVDFPTKNPIQQNYAGNGDLFLVKVDSSGRDLIYSSYLGGSGADETEGISADSEGVVYVTGWTSSSDFPTLNALQASYGGGDRDVFIAKLALLDATPPTYSLTVAAGSGGTTDPLPGTYSYTEGIEAAIRAVPDSAYTFSGWSGDASGTTNPITIAMDSDKSITASFIKISSDNDGGGGSDGKCFIATACYGTPMAEEVRILSAFRDRYLTTNPIGEDLVKFYETYSPGAADFIRGKEDIKAIIRACLKRVVWIINEFF